MREYDVPLVKCGSMRQASLCIKLVFWFLPGHDFPMRLLWQLTSKSPIFAIKQAWAARHTRSLPFFSTETYVGFAPSGYCSHGLLEPGARSITSSCLGARGLVTCLGLHPTQTFKPKPAIAGIFPLAQLASGPESCSAVPGSQGRDPWPSPPYLKESPGYGLQLLGRKWNGLSNREVTNLSRIGKANN